MRIGRDFTNCLLSDYLTEKDRNALLEGDMDLSTVNALVGEDLKRDVTGQIKTISELGMNHLELDADPPNPYLDMRESRKEEIKKFAEEKDVTLSLHLPYTYIGASLCCFQEADRTAAVNHAKECIQFASDVGATQLVTHPGSLPPYHGKGEYLEMAKKSLIQSLLELGEVSVAEGINLHLENNVAFDNFLVEADDCMEVVRRVREKGAEIYFNFDIGHWLTRADAGESIPENPVKILEGIPADFMKELHLNDYVPKEKIFHPPLHLQWGPLKKKYLSEYSRIIKRKDVEVLVLETAFKSVDHFRERDSLLKKETQYVRDIFGV